MLQLHLTTFGLSPIYCIVALVCRSLYSCSSLMTQFLASRDEQGSNAPSRFLYVRSSLRECPYAYIQLIITTSMFN